MRELIARLRDPVIAFDRDLAIIQVNRAAERTFGYSEHELIGEHYSVLRAVDTEARAARFRQVQERGFFDGEVGAFAHGEVIPVHVRCITVSHERIAYLSLIRPASTVMRVGQLYTLDETAAVLRKSTRTLRRMLHEGKLAGTKVGGTWRIPESELERLTRGRVPVLD